MKEKFDRIREICGGWGLYEEGNSTEQAQLLKALSEVGELADSILKNDREQAKDDIGDILVCLVNADKISGHSCIDDCYTGNPDSQFRVDIAILLHEIAYGIEFCGWARKLCVRALISIAKLFYLSIEECLDQAISVIEKRKGRIINGAFVKDTN